MVKTLQELRSQWEGTYQVKFHLDRIQESGNFLVVLQNKRGKYFCHRYFPVGEEWNLSADRGPCEANDVFDWLNDHVNLSFNERQQKAISV